MERQTDWTEVREMIVTLRKAAEELERLGADFPALARNAARILASVRMLEMNISDAVEQTTDLKAD